MTMTLVQRIELSSNQASITFNNIPQDATDLLFLVSCRTNRAATNEQLGMTINGDTTYVSSREIFGQGSTATSSTNASAYPYATGANATTNTFGNSSIYIAGYRSTILQKPISIDSVTENNASEAIQVIQAARWAFTNAITTVVFAPRNGGTAIVTGSTISLYKITSGSDGIVTVS